MEACSTMSACTRFDERSPRSRMLDRFRTSKMLKSGFPYLSDKRAELAIGTVLACELVEGGHGRQTLRGGPFSDCSSGPALSEGKMTGSCSSSAFRDGPTSACGHS